MKIKAIDSYSNDHFELERWKNESIAGVFVGGTTPRDSEETERVRATSTGRAVGAAAGATRHLGRGRRRRRRPVQWRRRTGRSGHRRSGRGRHGRTTTLPYLLPVHPAARRRSSLPSGFRGSFLRFLQENSGNSSCLAGFAHRRLSGTRIYWNLIFFLIIFHSFIFEFGNVD